MIELKLTGIKGGIAFIDDEDFDLVSEYKWHQTTRGYIVHMLWDKERKLQRPVWLHRLVMKASEDKEVDHIDHNLLNCQKYNLRLCTHEENSQNRKLHRNNSTGIKGVSIKSERKNKPYLAQIQASNKTYHLGYFDTKEEAGLAYEKASKQLHKGFGTFTKIDRKKGRPKKIPEIVRKDNTSGIRGINFSKTNQRWEVRIQKNGKRKRIGLFISKESAIKALKEAKKENKID